MAADLCRPGRAPPSFVSISVGSQKAFLSQTVFSPHLTQAGQRKIIYYPVKDSKVQVIVHPTKVEEQRLK